MATGVNDGQLSNRQIVLLAASISVDDMESIGEGYMDISPETLKNMKRDASNAEAFKREVIRYWSNKNPLNQIERLSHLLYRAAEECGYIDPSKIEQILGISREGDYLSQHYARTHLDRAYLEACSKENTKKVYNARMILAGYSEAGKTSLATRLLGGKINADKKQSTEGIALHRIESIFNNSKGQEKGEKWVETSINTSKLGIMFSHAVWTRVQEMTTGGISRKSTNGKKRKSMENKELDDQHNEAKITRTEESQLSRSTSEPEEASKVQTISDETMKELIENEKVPVELESKEKTPFALSVWDLGGQDEFISTHHLFLNTEATILIVMDITKGLHRLIGGKSELGYLNSPAEVLHYWLNLFHTDAVKHERTDKQNIAIVLTHTDKIEGNQNEYIDDYKKEIKELLHGKPYDKYIEKTKIYAVSNTTGSDSDFEKLRGNLFQHLIGQDTWGFKMPISWFKLKDYIVRMANLNGEKYLHLYEIWKLAEQLMMDTDDVESFLHKQTTMGDFVYFAEMRDFVITDPQWLVDKCKDLISTHDFIDERDLPAKLKSDLKKGEITENGLKQLWRDKCVVFLIRLMEKYDLLVDVSNGERRKYIIPCMLRSKFHKSVPSKVLIGSFPQFVSKCSKEKNWKLTQKDLSYTNATLDIGNNVELSLSLSQPVQIQTQFVWPKHMHSYDRDKIQKETKASLARILKTCQIQSADDEGDTPLTDYMLWSLAKEITNSSDVRTLGLKLGLDNSEITSSLNNRPNDINGAAFDVLRQWRDNQEDATVAYGKICEALKDAKQNFLIAKVLK